MKSFYLNFDTKNLTSGSPFNCHIKCDQPVQGKLNKIYLRSLEMPISWYNIRSDYNTFTIFKNGTAYTATVAEGNYTISTLLTAIATGLSTATGYTFSLTYSTTTNKVTISNINSVSFTVYSYTSLFDIASMLGFVNGQVSSSASVTATNCFNINFDTYVNLVFDNLPTSYLTQNPCTFKIPVTEG